MAGRWWCARGESIWESAEWEARYLWDDGALWGLSLVRSGSPERRETNHWDHSSQSLSGNVHSSFTAQERAGLTRALIAASPKERAAMSPVEKAVIDTAASALIKPDPTVSGRFLRSTLEKLTPAAVDAACRSLCPRYLRRTERVAGEAFELTFAGICESNDANAELTILSSTLVELAKLYSADPDVEEFRWAEVRDLAGAHGKAAMTLACNIWRSLGWDATARLDGAEYFSRYPRA